MLTPPPVHRRTATLVLECIGDDRREKARKLRARWGYLDLRHEIDLLRRGPSPWVADVTDGRRQFLRPGRSYEGANGCGSRGITHVFHLREGRTYEVHAITSWTTHERYFCTVRGGEIERIGRPLCHT